ncbi:PREDICTED: uncharacterized protein LOC104826805 [Tarenaya hassleriana]|uniref:uncharacterized protein LOC104826805 n=1 Tax=Tarenaya hassleriana TaxID=28532 RepID=UPI00053C1354|nr:PREDICTED: uncharacterized protein LOC104826805 [Tarenaya hassleriana]XP_010558006.1 PREDICTED: uncharacterized protein LOC104826805 [Tarenaya hassleriana]
MGFGVGSGGSKMLDFGTVQMHKRSKSFPDKKRAEGDNNSTSYVEASQRIKLDMGHSTELTRTKQKQSSPSTDVQNSLKQEIIQLERRLQEQFKVRSALEKALGYRTSSIYMASETKEIPMPKPTTQLIKEISVLELEVLHLEQYLLSLYRKAFEQKISSVSPPQSEKTRHKSPAMIPRWCLDFSEADTTLEADQSPIHSTNPTFDDNKSKEIDISVGDRSQIDASVHRSHSELSQRSAFDGRTSPEDSRARAVRSCHSQPLSKSEYPQNGENLISLAEHLGTRISDHVPETPNKLSEEMIKCMSAIYCKLAEPPSVIQDLSSPSSSLSSTSVFSPSDQYNTSFDVRLDNPFQVEGLNEFSGPYSTMVEVPCIYRDVKKASEVEDLLQNFKSLISRLEHVDPRKLRHEEKLAFWINVHNALVMHAFLAYGIPQNNVKRVLLLLKAAYNVGGHTVSADAIQSSILRCRMSRPGQWLRLLFASRKFREGDERMGYAIEHLEPLLYFALTSGSHSDPAVRVYTAKRIHQELETAKEEYVRASLGVRNGKMVLPKLVETFAKDSGLCVTEMVWKILPESSRKCLKRCKSRRGIEWIPHSFGFRYLISREAVR